MKSIIHKSKKFNTTNIRYTKKDSTKHVQSNKMKPTIKQKVFKATEEKDILGMMVGQSPPQLFVRIPLSEH